MNLLGQLQQHNPALHDPATRNRVSPAALDRSGEATCSRKACRAPAQWQLLWNNPKIHTPDRRKVWAACSEHRDWLQDYLQTRGLWKETLPLAGTTPEKPAGDPAPGDPADNRDTE